MLRFDATTDIVVKMADMGGKGASLSYGKYPRHLSGQMSGGGHCPESPL